jgi:anti-sigma regulatory factor (Ser/Thr protein kinase)
MISKIFPGNFENLEKISEFVKTAAKKAGFDEFTTYTIETSIDEACSNIIEHAYGIENIGSIEITINETEESLIFTLKDNGNPFNPDSIPTPDLSSNIDDRDEHGLGLYMMKQWMDEVVFEFKNNSNFLTIIKHKGS